MYPATMSHYKRDRNHGQGLPDNLGDDAYKRIQAKLEKTGHPVWDVRPAEEGDGGGHVLVRKCEERDPELLQKTGRRTKSAIIRTAHRRIFKAGDTVGHIRQGQLIEGIILQLLQSLAEGGEDIQEEAEVDFGGEIELIPIEELLLEEEMPEDGGSEIVLVIEDEMAAEDGDCACQEEEGDGFDIWSRIKHAAHRLADAVEEAAKNGPPPTPCKGCGRERS
jgi:hypothetical protein